MENYERIMTTDCRLMVDCYLTDVYLNCYIFAERNAENYSICKLNFKPETEILNSTHQLQLESIQEMKEPHKHD